jgi:hypothetical protein
MTLVAVAPHCRNLGFDGSDKEVREVYEVMELHDALQGKYKSDAHLVCYVVPGAKRQPRINKPGLPHFDRPVEMGVFFCDADNPGHSGWNHEAFADAMQLYETQEVLQTAGIYHTTHGRRIVQPLAEAIPVQEVEPYIRDWFARLERAGIPVDWSCSDWTRHYRLPNVIRDGFPFRSPWISLERMVPISLPELPSLPESEPPSSSSSSTSSSTSTSTADSKTPTPPPPPPQVNWTKELPPFWQERVEIIANAVRQVETEWHTLFMAIAGALHSRGVPQEHVPAVCRAISIAIGADSRTDDREAGARSTVKRILSRQRATGYTRLAREWPGVAAAIDEVTAKGAETRLRALADELSSREIPPLEETTAALEDAIRTAPHGVTLMGAECGLGKTEAAIKVAAERAAKQHVSPKATGERAPLQSKTSISPIEDLHLRRQKRPGPTGPEAIRGTWRLGQAHLWSPVGPGRRRQSLVPLWRGRRGARKRRAVYATGAVRRSRALQMRVLRWLHASAR